MRPGPRNRRDEGRALTALREGAWAAICGVVGRPLSPVRPVLMVRAVDGATANLVSWWPACWGKMNGSDSSVSRLPASIISSSDHDYRRGLHTRAPHSSNVLGLKLGELQQSLWASRLQVSRCTVLEWYVIL